MTVFFFDQLDRLLGKSGIIANIGEYLLQKSEVRNIQNKAVGNLRKRFRSEADNLVNIVKIEVANSFKACLHNLLIAMSVFGNSINILIVENLFLLVRCIVAVLYN